MYNPQRFKATDNKEARELMDSYSFATVISVVDGAPFVSHLPLVVKETSEGIELIGHLAKANPHWRFLSAAPVTVVFQGSHTYITPKWYAENDVPTWNYSVVHARGTSELIEDYEGLLQCLQDLTAHAETHWPSGWDFFIPEDLTGPEVLPKHIVGFRIRVENIDFKKKLSQNRSPEDRAGILKGLESRTDENSGAVLAEMLKLYSKDGQRL